MTTFTNHGRKALLFTAGFIAATILLLWGWNSAIPDLFGLPAMQFKQATGLMILLGVSSVALGHRHGRTHAA